MTIKDYYSQIREEERRNDAFLHLTANEPFMSKTARTFMGSVLNDRYYFGGGENGIIDFGPFTTLGFPGIESLVKAAEKATKEMLGASEVNLNCLSGVHAMMCVILSTTDPGDTIMTVHHDHGGHFATKGIVDRIGRGHVFAAYNFRELSFDAKELSEVYHKSNAKAFYIDASYYINPHNLKEIRAALGHDAIIIYDASHIMGLMMGERFQNPLKEGADVVCANTHKTLPGPQKGMIAFRESTFGKKANDIINSYLYSSPHTASLISLATTILEMKGFGKQYAAQVIANSNALGKALESLGYRVRKANTGRYSENHQVHLLTEELGSYKKLYRLLMKNRINVNFDNPLNTGTFIRLGTQEITRRGMKESEMNLIAEFIDRAFQKEQFAEDVSEFVSKYKHAHYSFDKL